MRRRHAPSSSTLPRRRHLVTTRRTTTRSSPAAVLLRSRKRQKSSNFGPASDKANGTSAAAGTSERGYRVLKVIDGEEEEEEEEEEEDEGEEETRERVIKTRLTATTTTTTAYSKGRSSSLPRKREEKVTVVATRSRISNLPATGTSTKSVKTVFTQQHLPAPPSPHLLRRPPPPPSPHKNRILSPLPTNHNHTTSNAHLHRQFNFGEKQQTGQQTTANRRVLFPSLEKKSDSDDEGEDEDDTPVASTSNLDHPFNRQGGTKGKGKEVHLSPSKRTRQKTTSQTSGPAGVNRTTRKTIAISDQENVEETQSRSQSKDSISQVRKRKRGGGFVISIQSSRSTQRGSRRGSLSAGGGGEDRERGRRGGRSAQGRKKDVEMEVDEVEVEDVEEEQEEDEVVGDEEEEGDEDEEEDDEGEGDEDHEEDEDEEGTSDSTTSSTTSDLRHLTSSSSTVLHRLLRSRLAKLFSKATGQDLALTSGMTKPPLVKGIIQARKGKGTRAGRKVRRNSQLVPTPPRSVDGESEEEEETEEEEEEGEEEEDEVEEEEEEEEEEEKEAIPTSSRVLRRSSSNSTSNSAGPISNVNSSTSRSGTLRTRKSAAGSAEAKEITLRNGKKVAVVTGANSKGKGKVVQRRTTRARNVTFTVEEGEEMGGDEEQDESDEVHSASSEEEVAPSDEEGLPSSSDEHTATGPSPVAHRTRHSTLPSSSAQSQSPPARSRPGRLAKTKAVAKLAGGSSSRRTHRQVETPPAEADEEEEDDERVADDEDDEEEEEVQSDDHEEEEANMSIEMVSHERAARKLRNGKVVVLGPPGSDEDEAMETASDGEEEEDATGESEDGEDAQMGSEDEDEAAEGEEVDLANATSKSLLRFTRDDLVKLCEERELGGEGTKKDLVHALLEWRDQDFDSPSDESSSHSTISATSNATARIRTRAHRDIKQPNGTTRPTAVPLLMRPNHSESPDKRRTAHRSKRDEQEEVNSLDLESLQLQDKEIAPEKLTKLEKIGSGGFKDVYKGLYRKKMIAIADIRGHLTDMDIKELGLLRDLRHPNIVHFIGVSIPKEPRMVPFMIVTELCANGDLFDYIRAVPAPPFQTILEIMLGIARGINYLHSRKPCIIHRDIKSSNVLITAQGVAKIADFGLARVSSTMSMMRSLVGTVCYQAPELWVPHPRYNEKVDVYSAGLVFWEMCQWTSPVKRYPFEGLNDHAVYQEVGAKKQRPSLISLRRLYGTSMADLIDCMWSSESKDRPSMLEVVQHLESFIEIEQSKA